MPGDGELRDVAPCALFITPLKGEDLSAEIPAAQARIHEAVGLLGSIESQLLVFEHVEDYMMDLAETATMNPASATFMDTTWMDTPGFDAQDRARWEAAASAIAAHTDSDRIRLSLRWLDDAKRTDGVDSFIKFWFSLETLSGADREDDVPKLLRDALGAIYGVDSSAATERFDMGRVYGLRSLIVHQGQRVEISPLLLRYLNAVYLDVLAHTLGVASGQRAAAELAKVGGIKDLLPSEVGGRSQEADAERSRL